MTARKLVFGTVAPGVALVGGCTNSQGILAAGPAGRPRANSPTVRTSSRSGGEDDAKASIKASGLMVCTVNA